MKHAVLSLSIPTEPVPVASGGRPRAAHGRFLCASLNIRPGFTTQAARDCFETAYKRRGCSSLGCEAHSHLALFSHGSSTRGFYGHPCGRRVYCLPISAGKEEVRKRALRHTRGYTVITSVARDAYSHEGTWFHPDTQTSTIPTRSSIPVDIGSEYRVWYQ